jgi:tripartite-type tricarboxylate transporter receptor subunit TctC
MMRKGVSRREFALGLGAMGLMPGASALAQDSATDYPNSQIRIVVSAAAGGGNDLIARILSERLLPILKQTIVVENRPGAGNNLAAEYVYRQPPDGYTLLCSPPAPVVVNAALFKSLRFDPDKLEPVTITSYIPNVLVVNPKSPFNTAQEFIAYAKANPGKLTYASQGLGTTGHLTGALFEELTGAKQVHVPFGGAAPALNDVVAGHVDFMFADIGTVLPLAQGNLLRILATLTKEAPPVAPDLPTIGSVGLPDLLSDTWTIFTAPPGTPLAIRRKLAQAFKEVMFQPDVSARLQKIGVVPWGLDVDQTKELVAKESKRWTDIVHKANVHIE